MLIFLHIVALVLCAALERAWPPGIRFGTIAPALPLVLVACIGITRGPVAGCAAGLLGGLLVASAPGGSFGVIIAGHMAVGLVAGKCRGRVFADHILVAPVVAVLATLAAELIELVVSPPSHFFPWLGELGLAMLYNALVSAPLYLFAQFINRRWPHREDA